MQKFLGKTFLLISLLLCCCSREDDTDVCFIGDSITYFWDLEKAFPDLVVEKHAVSGAKTEDALSWDLDDCAGTKSVLLIGTNDIGRNKSIHYDSLFLNRYFTLKSKIFAQPLIAISILPRNYNNKQNCNTNRNIQTHNHILQDSINKLNDETIYLNIYDLFLKDSCHIQEDLFRDGLHPNDAGYAIIAQELKKIL